MKRQLFGIAIDAMRMNQAVERIRKWIDMPDGTCRYVVTPNTDHAVLLQKNLPLQQAYQGADLVLADGYPIVWASWLLGQPLPERVAGSDLVPHLLAIADRRRPLKVFLLGAEPGVGSKAAQLIRQNWPTVQIVGVYSPPPGFHLDKDENELVLGRIALAQPDLLVIGLGAPKQECWVHAHRELIRASVAVCAGATIDFLANHRRRAPRWMQRAGVEWLHRVCGEPRRLAFRYAKDAWIFPQLVFRQWRQTRGSRHAQLQPRHAKLARPLPGEGPAGKV